MATTLTKDKLRLIFTTSVFVTEGYSKPYKFELSNFGAADSLASQKRMLGEVGGNNKVYVPELWEAVKGIKSTAERAAAVMKLQSQVDEHGDPTQLAREAKTLIGAVRVGLGTSGTSISGAQWDFGNRGPESKAKDWGLADGLPGETVTHYFARLAMMSVPPDSPLRAGMDFDTAVNKLVARLNAKLPESYLDKTGPTEDDRKVLDAFTATEQGRRAVDQLDAGIREQTVDKVWPTIQHLQDLGWPQADIDIAAAYAMKTFNQNPNTYVRVVESYLKGAQPRLDVLLTKLGGGYDSAKSATAVRFLATMDSVPAFSGYLDSLYGRMKTINSDMYKDPQVKAIFDLMAAYIGDAEPRKKDDTRIPSGSALVSCIIAAGGADQGTFLFQTPKGMGICDTSTGKIYVPLGGGAGYGVFAGGENPTFTPNVPLKLSTGTGEGGSLGLTLTSSSGSVAVEWAGGKLAFIDNRGAVEFVTIPAGATPTAAALGNLASIVGNHTLFGVNGAGGLPPGEYRVTDSGGKPIKGESLQVRAGQSGAITRVGFTIGGERTFGGISEPFSDPDTPPDDVDITHSYTDDVGRTVYETQATIGTTGITRTRKLVVDPSDGSAQLTERLVTADGRIGERTVYGRRDANNGYVQTGYELSSGESDSITHREIHGAIPMSFGDGEGKFTSAVPVKLQMDLVDGVWQISRIDDINQAGLSQEQQALVLDRLNALGADGRNFMIGDQDEATANLTEKISEELREFVSPRFVVDTNADSGHDLVYRGSLNGRTVRITFDRDDNGKMLASGITFDDDPGTDQTEVLAGINRLFDPAQLVGGANGAGLVEMLVAAADPHNASGLKPVAETPRDVPWYQDPERITVAASMTQNLLAAIRAKKPLPIATSLFSLAVAANPGGTLQEINGVIGDAVTLLNFRAALQRGDVFAATTSGTGVVRLVMEGYQSYLGSQIVAQYGSIAGARFAIDGGDEAAANMIAQYDGVGASLQEVGKFAQNVGAVVGIISALAQKHPNYMDAIMAAVAFVPVWGPMIAALYQLDKTAHQIFDRLIGHDLTLVLLGPLEEISGVVNGFFGSLFGTGLDIHGEARFESSRDGRNVHAVQTGSEDGGGDTVMQVMASLLATMKSVLGDNDKLGIVAERLPTLEWHGDEDGGGYFVMVYRDARTGESYKRMYDVEGRFSGFGDIEGGGIDPADAAQAGAELARTDQFFNSLQQDFIDMASRSDAFAPVWMVETVDAKRRHAVPIDDPDSEDLDGGTRVVMVGDAHAGWTTAQRAAAAGQLLASDPGDAAHGAAGAQQAARPIVLDLDGNGLAVASRAQGGGVLFDIDDDGYAEEVDWLNPRDGILVLDRNGDGHIAGGHEMFSDSQVDMAARGLHALDEIDANGDGKLTSADAVYKFLQIWQDVDHDGVLQDDELTTLAQRGITELDIGTGRFVMGGQALTMATVALTADAAGYNTQVVGNDVLIVEEPAAGQPAKMTLMVSAVADYADAFDDDVRDAHRRASDDEGLVVYDKIMDGAEDVAVLVSVEQLIAGGDLDAVGGRTVDWAGEAEHGTLTLDTTNGTVRFTPDADFNGTASFKYRVVDPQGRSVTAVAYVNVDAVNDAPVATNRVSTRAGRWEDLIQQPQTIENANGVRYDLPEEARAGAVTMADGIKAFAQTALNGEFGIVGFRDGRMYWGTGLVVADNDLGISAHEWRELDIVNQHAGQV